MNNLSFFREVIRHRDGGEKLVLATVVRTSGSTPREKGARMAVTEAGEVIGTVGGGYCESEAIKAALEVLRTGQPNLIHVEMMADASATTGAVCGGSVDVFVELISPLQVHN